LEIVIDAFVADRGEQCHICNSNLFLLEAFLPIRLMVTLSGIVTRFSVSMRTFATFPCPADFLAAGITFLPAFLEGA
jgi:hypothetical protein